MSGDGKLRLHQEAGARLSGVMGKGKGEAWAPATLFISHIVDLSSPDATESLTNPSEQRCCYSSSSRVGQVLLEDPADLEAGAEERSICHLASSGTPGRPPTHARLQPPPRHLRWYGRAYESSLRTNTDQDRFRHRRPHNLIVSRRAPESRLV